MCDRRLGRDALQGGCEQSSRRRRRGPPAFTSAQRQPDVVVSMEQLFRRILPDSAMLARADTVATIAKNWLTQFDRALAAADGARLDTMFHADADWRQLAQTRWSCTIRCTSIISPTCLFRRPGRLTFPKTNWPAGSRPTLRALS